MAFKVHVLDEKNRPTGERLTRTVAALLIRRQLADWIERNRSLRRRKLSEVNLSALPREHRPRRRILRDVPYQHHIEPKIIPLSIANSAYMRYLEGVR